MIDKNFEYILCCIFQTLLGQSIKDVAATSSNISEMLRLYFYAHSGENNKVFSNLIIV